MDVMYSSDGEGHWQRCEWSPQCPEKVFLADQCQGVEGHQDVHWCFGPSGKFIWQDNKNDSRHQMAAGSTPPGHKNYRTPEEMQQHYYLCHHVLTQVADSAIISMLEADETPEKDASINRPVKGCWRCNNTGRISEEDDPFDAGLPAGDGLLVCPQCNGKYFGQ
jgi:hypothetical protein